MTARVRLAAVGSAAAVLAAVGTAFVGPPASAATTPHTIVLDGSQLVAIRGQLTGTPSPKLAAAFAALKKSADAELSAGPWSVMDKNNTVSPDKHDYYSLATYFLPNPATANHCPYIHKDGVWGPEVATTGDLMARARSWQAISDLSLAWFYTGNAAYAARAELDVRTWFLNAATKMNPNMTFAQVVPCTTVGRKEGIIESSEAITQVVDALAILDSGAPGWMPADHTGMVSWLTQFLTWNRTSGLGKAESKATNNHGTFKDLQDAVLMLYVGQTTAAKTLIGSVRANRIAKQVKGDGSMPGELSRTRPWHYVNFNTQAYCRLAEAGRAVGLNLWGYKAPGGGTIAKAIDFMIPAGTKGPSAWTRSDLDVFDQSLPSDKLHAAAEQGGDPKAAAAVPKVPAPSVGDLWPVQPACWIDLGEPPVQK